MYIHESEDVHSLLPVSYFSSPNEIRPIEIIMRGDEKEKIISCAPGKLISVMNAFPHLARIRASRTDRICPVLCSTNVNTAIRKSDHHRTHSLAVWNTSLGNGWWKFDKHHVWTKNDVRDSCLFFLRQFSESLAFVDPPRWHATLEDSRLIVEPPLNDW